MQQRHETAPARAAGSFSEFDPLAEIRLDPAHLLRDVEEVVQVLLEPAESGPAHYWEHEAASWLKAVIVHLFFCRKDRGSDRPTLVEVFCFLHDIPATLEAETFETVCTAMRDFDHGVPAVNTLVREAVQCMQDKAPQERVGVHARAVAEINLWVGGPHRKAAV